MKPALVDALFIAAYAVGLTALFVAELVYKPRWYQSLLMWGAVVAPGMAFEFWRRDLGPVDGLVTGATLVVLFCAGNHLREWWFDKIMYRNVDR